MLAFCCSAAAQEVPPDCPSENARPAVMLAYLQQDRAVLDRTCAGKAIHFLGLKEYKPAIPTLIDYLDFEAPEPPSAMHLANSMFPAADALARFQQCSRPRPQESHPR
jgi:hypothetical protein